ncbi:MAG: hypothetical protein IT385_17810 [Deltaproteobacteria bacterium]|nr:hypothetical protein [Deltaproteobacteria bacterium]
MTAAVHRIVAALAAVVTLGLTTPASAELIQPGAPLATPNRVTLTFGLEHGLSSELAYTRALDLDDVRLTLVGRLELPASPDFTDGGVALGAAAHLIGDDGWGAGVRLLATTRWVQGALLDVTQLGVIVGVDGGYYRPGGSVALELAWDGALVTRVAPTDRYRRLVYAADPVTVGHGGGVLRLGLAATLTLADVIELGLRGGLVATEELGAVPGMPLFVTLSIGARW